MTAAAAATQPEPQPAERFQWRRHGGKHMLVGETSDVAGVVVAVVVTALSRAAPEQDRALWFAHKLQLTVAGYGFLQADEVAISDIPAKWLPCSPDHVPVHIRSDFATTFDSASNQ
jgi:hypothetical protein